jgi:hypothetical protein
MMSMEPCGALPRKCLFICLFKKLAGVQQSLPCKLRVYNQKGEKVPFEINTTFSYTLEVAR